MVLWRGNQIQFYCVQLIYRFLRCRGLLNVLLQEGKSLLELP